VNAAVQGLHRQGELLHAQALWRHWRAMMVHMPFSRLNVDSGWCRVSAPILACGVRRLFVLSAAMALYEVI
jgi:hypothetical protein